MGSTIIIGLIFIGILGWAIYKSIQSVKNNSCPGCSGNCSTEQKRKCNQKK